MASPIPMPEKLEVSTSNTNQSTGGNLSQDFGGFNSSTNFNSPFGSKGLDLGNIFGNSGSSGGLNINTLLIVAGVGILAFLILKGR